MESKLSFLSAVALFALRVSAQASAWGQCGGTGWTGATTCVSGYVCTYSNQYYSQCIPGTASASGTSSSTASSPTLPANTKYFVTFGDSYSQTGFDITSTKPSAASPEGNPPLPGWTTSGGLNWIGNLISVYNTSLTLSYNFASGGSTTDANVVSQSVGGALDLPHQVALFSSNLASKPSYAPWTSSNMLVGVWMGVNDVGNSYYNTNATEATILGKLMDTYFAQMQILYNAGVRNFALLGVPTVSRTPAMLAQSTTAQQEELYVEGEYNSLLASRLATFMSANSGVTGKVIDTQTPFNTALNNPTAYGATDASCYNSDGKTCLWFNDYHPGMAIHKLVAQAVQTAFKGSFF